MDNRLEFLKTVTPFNLLPEDVLLGVVDLLQEVRYTKETLIYQQDSSKLRSLDIIVAGQYEAFFYDSEQNKRLPEALRAGSCYGGQSILLKRVPSSTRCPAATFGRCAWLIRLSSTSSRRSTASECSTKSTPIL
jgi:signal-transduction protein with cAMP-binding, CBS, and nucleotidyltransferase domain